MKSTVIVTGAANGIGKAIATAYAEAGWNTVLADIDAAHGSSCASGLTDAGYSAKFMQCDVSVPDDLKVLVRETADLYGGIHALINNAGVSEFESPLELTVENWDRILNTNLRSCFLLSREAAPLMKGRHGASIINIASTRAIMSEKNSEAYAASKGGIVALTHALALSLSDLGIRVNCISPGWIKTGEYATLRDIDHEQHPSGRVGRPSDIARACLFLTDPENDFITGENLVIDGGMTRKMIYEH
ncbi:SDR family NAD(P)-dependent oxidoreductase [Rhodohalobacter mucosus]|uniref:3-ketoacyl-ACP reductase n=1 Tax=Rhodohalobacter mucosus TaxID=2079485 RepID=A0A316TVP3_9BACT|nr:glucose 1-dehydrogenase [Rhodohalobacter mucosus]PWN06582.1 3-ketoacyl-ACP reductase [Rhodohalobacter mucosus]